MAGDKSGGNPAGLEPEPWANRSWRGGPQPQLAAPTMPCANGAGAARGRQKPAFSPPAIRGPFMSFFFFFLPFPFPFLSRAWRFEEPGCNKVGFRDQRGPEIPRASRLRALCPPLPPPNMNIRANHPPHNACVGWKEPVSCFFSIYFLIRV